MKKLLPKVLIGIGLLINFALSGTINQTYAVSVNSIGIATYLPINGKSENGDIIISTAEGYFVSKKAYDPQIIGVATTNPAIALRTSKEQNGIPVVNVGTVIVKVTGKNGPIQKGDHITTSDVPGAGMKATKSGYVIGQAVQPATFAKPDDIKTIQVTMNLHFLQRGSPATSSLFDIFSLTQIATYEEPLRVFRYVISAIVLIMSFGFGFVIFSKAINTGIEALGRNPLAARTIQLSILFNVVLVIIIIMTGIGIVYLFLRL